MHKDPRGFKVGDLVRYRYDSVSNKTHLISKVYDAVGGRYCNLFGWNRPNAVGTVQAFRLDQLELISESR
jgi:hypothetical protein